MVLENIFCVFFKPNVLSLPTEINSRVQLGVTLIEYMGTIRGDFN